MHVVDYSIYLFIKSTESWKLKGFFCFFSTNCLRSKPCPLCNTFIVMGSTVLRLLILGRKSELHEHEANVLLIALKVKWLASRCWRSAKGNDSTAGSEAPTAQLQDVWKLSSPASARHNMALPFTAHIPRRNPTTTIHQPIKKLCIIYHVIWLCSQVECDLQLILGNFPSASRQGQRKKKMSVIWFVLCYHFKCCPLLAWNKKKKNTVLPEIWWHLFKYKK